MISPVEFFECVGCAVGEFAEQPVHNGGGSLIACALAEVVGEFFTGGGDHGCGAFGLFTKLRIFAVFFELSPVGVRLRMPSGCR